MSLPVFTTPVYNLTIPSSQKEYKYRPFLVGDQKALMIAQQSDDPKVMFETLKQLIVSCAKSDIDVHSLSSFDVEYMFLQLRAVSQGEMVTLYFRCESDHGEEQDKAIAKVTVDIRDAKVETFSNHSSKIKLTDTTGVVMKYPTLDVLKKVKSQTSMTFDEMLHVTTQCIDYIYDAESVHSPQDYSQAELIAWLNTLTAQQFNEIQQFFKTMPRLRLYVNYECPLCHRQYNRYVEGLSSFF